MKKLVGIVCAFFCLFNLFHLINVLLSGLGKEVSRIIFFILINDAILSFGFGISVVKLVKLKGIGYLLMVLSLLYMFIGGPLVEVFFGI